MDKVQRMKQEQQYEKYVKQKTPKHNVWVNMLKAFLLGGAIIICGILISQLSLPDHREAERRILTKYSHTA